jgi:hypothetical protein
MSTVAESPVGCVRGGVFLLSPQVLIEISKVQDSEVGDGTTSVVVFAGELLRQAEILINMKIHPMTVIAGFREACAVARTALEERAQSNKSNEEQFRKDLMNVARTTLSSKILTQVCAWPQRPLSSSHPLSFERNAPNFSKIDAIGICGASKLLSPSSTFCEQSIRQACDLFAALVLASIHPCSYADVTVLLVPLDDILQDKNHFAELAVDAVMRLKGYPNLEYIHIIKKPGGTLKESFLDEGFILDKKIGVGQPKRMENAKILVRFVALTLFVARFSLTRRLFERYDYRRQFRRRFALIESPRTRGRPMGRR